MLGFDDEMSTDHDWSAKVIVFVDTVDADRVEAVQHELRAAMPTTFNDVPTGLDVTTVAGYFQRELGLNVADQWDAYDWLSLPEHRLCAITSGGVFHDEVGLNTVRERLNYYPRDVWYYLLGAGWWRLHPEMNLVGRSGYAGDDLGSALIAADMVSALMHMSFFDRTTLRTIPKVVRDSVRKARHCQRISSRTAARPSQPHLAGPRTGPGSRLRSSRHRLQRPRHHRLPAARTHPPMGATVRRTLGRLPNELSARASLTRPPRTLCGSGLRPAASTRCGTSCGHRAASPPCAS